MIEQPIPLEEAVFAALETQVSPNVAASLAALQLGASLMMSSVSELVYKEFSEDTDLQWPKISQHSGFEITSTDLSKADQMAGAITRQRESRLNVTEPLLNDIRQALFNRTSREAVRTAMALSLANMSHGDSLIRVTAAIASLSFVRNPIRVGQAVNILKGALAEPNDSLIQELAHTGLCHFFRSSFWSPLKQMSLPVRLFFRGQARPPTSTSQNTALIVNGTMFQRHGQRSDHEWWHPHLGDLHQYFKNGCRPNLYSGADHYRWSGGWNDYAREEAAEKLIDWMDARGIQSPDVFAHSHGCNVVILANQARAFSTLVLMSCPVHSTRHPINCRKALSIRIRWDLVIMADGGGQRFPASTNIVEHILPFWFTGHEASRQSETWKARNLDTLI